MNSKKLSIGLFSFYFFALTWIILFKFSFSPAELPHLRNINLIPFAESVIVNGTIDFSEIFQNLFAFIPFGVLISTILEKKSFLTKLLSDFWSSLAFETLQFIFFYRGKRHHRHNNKHSRGTDWYRHLLFIKENFQTKLYKSNQYD